MKKLIYLFVCILMLYGCATTGSKMNHISVGMTKQEVIAIMGEPYSTSAEEGVEYMYYRSDSLLLALSTPPGYSYRPSSPYFIRLINGSVESYGRVPENKSTIDVNIQKSYP